MKKVSLGILMVIMMIFLISCSNNDKNTTNQLKESMENLEVTLPEVDNEETESTDSDQNVENENPDETDPVDLEDADDNETIPVIDPEGKIFSKLTGLQITNEQSLLRPIVVQLDNHYRARPQAGLIDADVVYEILAEGSITRYMAVFQSNQADVIGPVRSSRPYFIEKALEFNPLYVHVGGSNQAFADIRSYEMADIDGLSSGGGVFYRTDHKNMPHNMYSSDEGIRGEGIRKKYYTEVEFEGLPITYQIRPIEGENAESVKIVYKSTSAGDSVGYYVYFEYDSEEGKYYRYVNGEKHLDENNDLHLYADNIIVQQVGHRVIDDEGRKDIDIVGSGEGYYINRGQVISITWEKTSARAQTRFFKADGSELILNPGKTWIQVVPLSTEPIID